jgi:hypothetical protein
MDALSCFTSCDILCNPRKYLNTSRCGMHIWKAVAQSHEAASRWCQFWCPLSDANDSQLSRRLANDKKTRERIHPSLSHTTNAQLL